MCKFIGIEVLAANALIETIEEKKNRSITLSKLKEYGLKVAQYLEKNYEEQTVVLYTADSHNDSRILAYPDFFELRDTEVYVKNEITPEQLRKKFRTPLPYDLWKAVLSDEVKQTLFMV